MFKKFFSFVRSKCRYIYNHVDMVDIAGIFTFIFFPVAVVIYLVVGSIHSFFTDRVCRWLMIVSFLIFATLAFVSYVYYPEINGWRGHNSSIQSN